MREDDADEGVSATSVAVDDVDDDGERVDLFDGIETFNFGAPTVMFRENVNFVTFSFSARCEVLGGVRRVIVEGQWTTS